MPPMDESSLECHGAGYVPYARGWYACPARTVRVALGQAALRLTLVQYARGWYARSVRTVGGPGAYV